MLCCFLPYNNVNLCSLFNWNLLFVCFFVIEMYEFLCILEKLIYMEIKEFCLL